MSTTVAVVGATGAVGRAMLRVLEEHNFPVGELRPLASARSAGTELPFRGGVVTVRELTAEAFEGVDFALFSAGASVSRTWGPIAAAKGATVIDNSSAWRMDPDVPLVVPEVNLAAAFHRPKGIIANPNCSTIQMVVALKPLHDAAGLAHVTVATYQATSGKGQAAVTELRAQAQAVLAGEEPVAAVFPKPMAFNVLSDWKAGEGDYSEEEWKMVHETRKILGLPELSVSPTTVRVPVENGHSEAIWARFTRPLPPEEAKAILAKAPGVVLDGAPYAPGAGPNPRSASGRDEVFVGRVRADVGVPGGLCLFVVADNLRKGAATNAVQIARGLYDAR